MAGRDRPDPRLILWRAEDPAAPQRILLDTPVRAVFSTGWSSISLRGFTFAPDIAYERVDFLSPFARLRLSTGVVFATERYGDDFYAVDLQYARPGRPAFDGRAGYMGARIFASHRVPVHEGLSVLVGGRVENFSGAANADSPLFRREWNVSVVAGFALALWQSDARVDVAAQPFG